MTDYGTLAAILKKFITKLIVRVHFGLGALYHRFIIRGTVHHLGLFRLGGHQDRNRLTEFISQTTIGIGGLQGATLRFMINSESAILALSLLSDNRASNYPQTSPTWCISLPSE